MEVQTQKIISKYLKPSNIDNVLRWLKRQGKDVDRRYIELVIKGEIVDFQAKESILNELNRVIDQRILKVK